MSWVVTVLSELSSYAILFLTDACLQCLPLCGESGGTIIFCSHTCEIVGMYICDLILENHPFGCKCSNHKFYSANLFVDSFKLFSMPKLQEKILKNSLLL